MPLRMSIDIDYSVGPRSRQALDLHTHGLYTHGFTHGYAYKPWVYVCVRARVSACVQVYGHAGTPNNIACLSTSIEQLGQEADARGHQGWRQVLAGLRKVG